MAVIKAWSYVSTSFIIRFTSAGLKSPPLDTISSPDKPHDSPRPRIDPKWIVSRNGSMPLGGLQ
jgi:hypothetical protein